MIFDVQMAPVESCETLEIYKCSAKCIVLLNDDSVLKLRCHMAKPTK